MKRSAASVTYKFETINEVVKPFLWHYTLFLGSWFFSFVAMIFYAAELHLSREPGFLLAKVSAILLYSCISTLRGCRFKFYY